MKIGSKMDNENGNDKRDFETAKPDAGKPAAGGASANVPPSADQASGSKPEPVVAEKRSAASVQKKKRGKLGLWLKIFGGLSVLGVICAIAVLIYAMIYVNNLKPDLPDEQVLAEYQPAVTTRVHAGDGSLVAEYATERRLFVPIEDMPDTIKNAIVAAEDKTFYEHSGVDFKGIVRANINNLKNRFQGSLQGGSTITQQVAKNFLLTSDQKIERKVKEMLIARRMEDSFSKDHILELYLNEIYLGNRSYGVAAAALNYFGKSLDELSVAEAAYLAVLPKAPSRYHPEFNKDRSIARRNYVVDRMLEDGYITQEIADEAKEAELGATMSPPLGARSADTEYFAEEVRKQVAELYGFSALYEGGLSIRSTLDPRLQSAAQRAFRKWLVEYDHRHGWRGPLGTMLLPGDLSALAPKSREGEADKFVWQVSLKEKATELDAANLYAEDLAPWRIAVVLATSQERARIGFEDGTTGDIALSNMLWAKDYVDENHTAQKEVTDVRTVVSPGDVILAEAIMPEQAETSEGATEDAAEEAPVAITEYALMQVPAVNGGFIAIDPHTGRVKAMVGGFSFGLSEFNRATQARRQPGSTFKPFVYAAAIDNGYTPSSIVLDAPFVAPSLNDEWWKPGNYIAGRFYGESTLRLGIEKSRNTMTARLAQDIGIGLIIEYAERFGVSDRLPRELAISLGAGETTLIDITTAYAMFVNGGRNIEPIFIDRVQDRYGETVLKQDQRECFECKVEDWQGQTEPKLRDERDAVIDPRTAYQMVSILEGVIQRGTGAKIKNQVDRPLAGKTGTTDDYRDAWFIGFSPDLAAGIYVGFDLPASMGDGEGGGIVAAPIFGEFMAEALKDEPVLPFRTPSGIRLVRVNAKTGKPALPGDTNVILEAFKAEDDIYAGTGDSQINGRAVNEGSTDENIANDLGGIY